MYSKRISHDDGEPETTDFASGDPEAQLYDMMGLDHYIYLFVFSHVSLFIR